MKRTWILMTLVFLLCGCSREAPEALTETLPALQTEAPGEDATLREVPLDTADCIGLHPMGEDLLLLSPGAEGIIFSRLSHETLATTAAAEVALAFSGEVPGLQVSANRVCFFDSRAGQTVVLDGQLREVARIDAPEGLVGVPLLSEDGESLFYCTDGSIRCLELSDRVSRVLKEDDNPGKTLRALVLEDTVLQCVYQDPVLGPRSLFLSTGTGKTLFEGSGEIHVRSFGGSYFADLPEGEGLALVFGSPDRRPQALLPRDPLALGTLLPESGGAVTARLSTGTPETLLDYYDLNTGKRTGELRLSSDHFPRSFCSTGEGIVYFLLRDDTRDRDILLRWDTAAEPVADSVTRTASYYTAADPDLEGLQECREEAQRISDRFGVQVLIWTDAARTQPWDYILEPEHRVETLRQELRLLEERLARYPQDFLRALGQGAGSLSICLVRAISPSPENGGGMAVDGLQFWAEDRSFVALAMGEGCERALYHELCHIIDTQVFSTSHAYDSWDSLNPGDFEYDYDYEKNKSRDGSRFLQETSRSFIDTFSMSFPREDRARIMEYAMTPGNAEVFAAPILQQKLRRLCTGIREAFGLTDYPPLPWEQYLLTPLAPASKE